MYNSQINASIFIHDWNSCILPRSPKVLFRHMIQFLDLLQQRLYIFNREWLGDVDIPACCALVYHVNDLLVCRRFRVIIFLVCSGFPDYENEFGMEAMVYRGEKYQKEYAKDCTADLLDCTVAFLLSRNGCDGFIVLAGTGDSREGIHHATPSPVNNLRYPAFSIDSLATTSKVTSTYVHFLRFEEPNCQ